MKLFSVPLLIVMLAGCAGGTVVVKMSPPGAGEEAGQASLAEVQVKDLRPTGVTASTREAAFGVPMGSILFDPPETHLVKQTLESELTRRLREKGIAGKRTYSCDLAEFGVSTVATPVYWDVVSRVRLVLKRNGKEYPLSGTDTRRTYVWPGETIIRGVVETSLKQVMSGLTPAIED